MYKVLIILTSYLCLFGNQMFFQQTNNGEPLLRLGNEFICSLENGNLVLNDKVQNGFLIEEKADTLIYYQEHDFYTDSTEEGSYAGFIITHVSKADSVLQSIGVCIDFDNRPEGRFLENFQRKMFPELKETLVFEDEWSKDYNSKTYKELIGIHPPQHSLVKKWRLYYEVKVLK
ncbi:hypothetical protein [Lishizhenia sp.]|uniref:hypothetical protein n=1 Tax=Lishizhenia sp. TaxID=2497594 RepID=UPI00299D6A95|nr:hypothetical protein [Lishizhenia sp.]MDX1446928.1 hypothetical protein [Lishizhenia sp.]